MESIVTFSKTQTFSNTSGMKTEKEVAGLAKNIYKAEHEAPPSSAMLRQQLYQKLSNTSLSKILTDPLFNQLSLEDKKILLNRIMTALKNPACWPVLLPKGFDNAKESQRLCDLLPERFDSELVDFVDSCYLPKEVPPSNLYGKHLVAYYQRMTADLSENQRRLYANKILKHTAFELRLIPAEQKAVLTNLRLSIEGYARLKKDLTASQQREIGPMLDVLGGNNLAVVPYGQLHAQNKDRKPMTSKKWVEELRTSPRVLSEIKSSSIVGSGAELITLQDAKAIVRVFPDQYISISKYVITPEALEFIKTHAPKIRCNHVVVENRPAQNGEKKLLETDLDQKWKNAPKIAGYHISEAASRHELPLIDAQDAEEIVKTNIRPIISGYAITWDALSVFDRSSINIDRNSNLLVINLDHSDFSQPVDWAREMQANALFSAPKTDFDELNRIEQLREALEPTNAFLLITKKKETIDLDDARCIASTLKGSKVIKLVGYTLTNDAAEYLKVNASNVVFSNPTSISGTT